MSQLSNTSYIACIHIIYIPKHEMEKKKKLQHLDINYTTAVAPLLHVQTSVQAAIRGLAAVDVF